MKDIIIKKNKLCKNSMELRSMKFSTQLKKGTSYKIS